MSAPAKTEKVQAEKTEDSVSTEESSSEESHQSKHKDHKHKDKEHKHKDKHHHHHHHHHDEKDGDGKGDDEKHKDKHKHHHHHHHDKDKDSKDGKHKHHHHKDAKHGAGAAGSAADVFQAITDEKNTRLWLTIVEGKDLPSNVSETKVCAAVGKVRLVPPKSAENNAGAAKWGEVFIFDRFMNEDQLVIDVENGKGTVFMSVKLATKEIFEKKEIHQWYTNGDSGSGPSIRVFARVIPIAVEQQTVNERLPSIRFELEKSVYKPGDVMKGVLVFAANRTRIFHEATMTVQHGTEWEGDDLEFFNKKMHVPHRFEHPNANAPGEFKIPPGLYFWPFEVILPAKMYIAKANGKKSDGYFKLSVTFKESMLFSKSFTLSIDVNAPKPISSHAKCDEPKVTFFPDEPFVPHDNIHENTDPLGANQMRRVPSSGLSTAVRRALYPSH